MTLPGGRDGDEPVDLGEDAILAEEELALPADERLPWLESDDDYEQPGIDTGRIVAFVATGLLIALVLAGGLWWWLSGRSQQELVADGSTIEAPDEPYKTRPEDPGGMEVEGTGDTSFEVAEGEQVEGRLASDGAPAPSIDREQADSADEPASGIGVQVGAYSTRAQAEAGWSTLAGRLEPLQGRSHRILEGTADSGRIFRLQALAGTVAEAETLCRGIKAAGGDCQVKR
jgi:hypothetical protein